jgi:DNA-binding MarR family transcriptional regulator
LAISKSPFEGTAPSNCLLGPFYLDVKIFIMGSIAGILGAMNRDIIDELRADWSEQRPELDTEAIGVVLRIQALAKILGDQASERLSRYGLQWWQYDVLSALRRQGRPYRLMATELAEAGRLTSGSMTNRIDRLEGGGLVRRLHDARDRRRVLVELTARGRKLVDQATAERFKAAANALDSLDRQQRRLLGDLLRDLLLAHQDWPKP